MTEISAPAGSGKTLLLRSWIGHSGLAERTAWVPVQGEERDPQRFWLSVLGALRDTAAGSKLVRPLTAAPDLDGWAVVERLLTDLGGLADRVWLVIDDLHELRSAEALSQLELLHARPGGLAVRAFHRHDLRLGLHRLRLAGELTEIRADGLRFTRRPTRRALFEAAGIPLSAEALARLHDRTEGWAAGLRLAALSLAGHPEPDRFAAEFSGSERTVAEYLLAEVLERQPERARRLLFRTSVLERVNGELADLLTGGSGGERVLQELEQANAFVVALDARRSWFRYHQLFAELLQLELRGSTPSELPALHAAAAGWYAAHGFALEAVRHATAAPGLGPGRPPALGRLARPRPQGAGRHRARTPGRVPGRRDRAGSRAGRTDGRRRTSPRIAGGGRTVPGSCRPVTGLGARPGAPARSWSSPSCACGSPASAATSRRWPSTRGGWWPPPSRRRDPAGLGEELRALALINLGIAEWTEQFEEAERHLEQGVTLAHRIGRPFLEFTGLAHQASCELTGRSRARRSAAGRRSSWPNGTAGPTSRSPAPPT